MIKRKRRHSRDRIEYIKFRNLFDFLSHFTFICLTFNQIEQQSLKMFLTRFNSSCVVNFKQ